MKMNLWKDYFRLRPIPGLQVYSFGSCKASQLSFHLMSQKNNNHLQIGKKLILQKIAPQEYFEHWGFSFLYPLAIQNHQKNRSFPKSNSKVAEQTCEKIAKVIPIFQCWLVGWQAGLAGWHARIHMNHIHMLSHSIQRLHTKFQPNRLKNAEVMHIFHF